VLNGAITNNSTSIVATDLAGSDLSSLRVETVQLAN